MGTKYFIVAENNKKLFDVICKNMEVFGWKRMGKPVRYHEWEYQWQQAFQKEVI